MKKIKKLSGSSLFITIIFSLVLGILCSALILLAYYNRQTQQRDDIENKLDNNIVSAVNLLLADTSINNLTTDEAIDLFNEGNDSVTIHKTIWGIFQVGSIRATYSKFSKQKTFFYGEGLPDSLHGCIYLADHQKSLSLTGNTKLTGDAYLSRGGVKAGYIGQRGFSFQNLIDGKTIISSINLPVIKNQITKNLSDLLSVCNDTSRTEKMIRLVDRDSLFRSFDSSSVFTFNGSRSILENCNLNGQIVVFSDSIIEVRSNAILKDVILVAPAVKVDDGFKGTLQIIASDSLIIGDNCTFHYPSSLILQKKGTQTIQNILMIGDHCKISGQVISLCSTDDLYKSYLEIGSNSSIEGIIYSMGYLNLKANVSGTVLTDYFIYKTPSAIFENYLVDIEINRNRLSPFFVSGCLFKSVSNKNIIQWVD